MRLRSLVFFAAHLAGIEAAQQRVLTCAPRPTQQALLRSRQTGCQPDACLNAIQASAQGLCTRLGDVDCASYFVATIQPDISTVYETIVVSTTQTATESVTRRTVIDGTSSWVIDETATTSTTSTSTVPISNTVTESTTRTATTVYITPTPATAEDTATQTTTTTTYEPLVALPLRKRKKRAIVNQFPQYASACGGEAGYSSACSYIGVTRGTTSATVGVTTTITVSLYTSATVSESTEVATESSTTWTTQTVSSTVSTETSRSTVTAQGPFYIYVKEELPRNSGDTNVAAVGRYVTQDFLTYEHSPLFLGTFDRSAAAQYYIDGKGYLRAVVAPIDAAFFAYQDVQTGMDLYLRGKNQVNSMLGVSVLNCTIAPESNELACSAPRLPRPFDPPPAGPLPPAETFLDMNLRLGFGPEIPAASSYNKLVLVAVPIAESTAVLTQSATANATGPFYLQVASQAGPSWQTNLVGNYAANEFRQDTSGSSSSFLIFPTADVNLASQFWIDADGVLRSAGPAANPFDAYWGYYDYGWESVLSLTNLGDAVAWAPDYVMLDCAVTAGSNALVCGGAGRSRYGADTILSCSSGVQMAFGPRAVASSSCAVLSVVAVPV
ncbi:hypothetical protein GE09DRAFT_1282367 [Coniochaeta sp. 2T2.1]|nr:hypothetical protein GE09DRAFT_1282367 [Coniochaeta sp. 2T2.1]